MSKFQLTGVQRDTVRSLAIHQDAEGLFDFIEELVAELVKKGTLTEAPAGPVPLSALEQAVVDLVKANG